MKNTEIENIQKTLKKQLELLNERSKDCPDDCLADITDAMVHIYTALTAI
ncbi:MAG: hypothetical protein E6X72_00245 [Clostridioides difficile]|nr:hypothetical protein [Clostridium butyricum]EMU52303.1 hypothetical protein CBDKU1_37350 [Clostridium butyricum DKU-01]MDU4852810.1 hypothetical protein [Clostridioides difficile]